MKTKSAEPRVNAQASDSARSRHFLAAGAVTQTGRCCGLGSLLSVCCDQVSVWQEQAASLDDYMTSQGKGARILAYAFGTPLDDQIALADLNEQDEADAGIYSLALGIQCHSKSRERFNDYLNGGEQISVTRLPGQQFEEYWPESWFETPRHRGQSLGHYGISLGEPY